MPEHQDYPFFAVMNSQGQIFGSTRARSVFEAQFKLGEGLLYPRLESGEGRELIGADLVAAIWRLAEKLGWRITKSSSEKSDSGKGPEDNPVPGSE